MLNFRKGIFVKPLKLLFFHIVALNCYPHEVFNFIILDKWWLEGNNWLQKLQRNGKR